MSELRIKNRREIDLRSYEVTQLQIKPRKNYDNNSYNGYKLKSHLTCFRRDFIAQSVEHRTGIAEV